MKNLSELKTKSNNVPILLMVLLCANKWLIEGIIDETLLELVLLGAGVAMILWQRGLTIRKQSCIWLVYCFSLLSNVLLHGFAINIIGRVLIMVTIVLYAVLGDDQHFDVRKVLKLLVWMAVFHAVMILIQYLLRETFNQFYFPLLARNEANNASRYFKRGYYYGIHYSPHEVAGILSFAISALLLDVLVEPGKKWGHYGVALFLMIPLFLTGKKGVLLLAVAAFVVTAGIQLISGKQWKKLAIICGALLAACCVAFVYIQINPDNVLFRRFTEFFAQLSAGESVTSGRSDLYRIAIREWKNHKLFGIGWYRFISLITSKYGYEASHQVNLDYLQWLCELGIVGFLLNLIPVAVSLYQTVYVGFEVLRHLDNKRKHLVLFAVFVQMFTLVYAFVEVPFYDIYFFAMYMISCMIIAGAYADGRKMTGKAPGAGLTGGSDGV